MIVVDCATDTSKINEFLDQIKITPKVILTDIRNPYDARNLGISAAKGDVIAFLDAKSEPESSWLDNGIDLIKQHSTGVLAGKYEVHPVSNKLEDQIYGLLYLNNLKNTNKNYGTTTGNLFVTKKVFDKLGSFKSDFISGNDIEWTKRYLAIYKKPILYGETVVVRYIGQSYDEVVTSIKKYSKGIVNLKRNTGNSKMQTFYSGLSYFLPVRLKTFNESIEYRKLRALSFQKKIYLWLKLWEVKIRMGVNYYHFLFQ